MIPVYLIGGGWKAEISPQTYGRFLESASRNNPCRIAIIVAEEPDSDAREQFQRFFKVFESIGLSHAEAFELLVSAKNPLSKEKLAAIKPTGVFVCGGLTPAYHAALCTDKSWLDFLFENRIPYCGFSAGASIASEKAIIGGWRRETHGQTIQIADENASEDLDMLNVRAGLGLVPFAVEVHAAQWGTLSRLIHTIDASLADEGWAIDENTMLEVFEQDVRIYGAGSAYHIGRNGNEINIKIVRPAN